VISNPNNSTIKQIRKLRKRRERDRTRRMIVEGHRALGVAIRAQAGVSYVLHTTDAAVRRADLLRTARAAGAKVLEVTADVMVSLTSVSTAPDVLGVAPIPATTLNDAVSKLGLGAVLAGIRDPATAGSILSSCAAAGGSVAIATKGTTDLFAPKPVRSGAGAHFVLAIAPDVSVEECARALRDGGARVAVLDRVGRDPSEADLGDPIAVVITGEDALPATFGEAGEEHVAVAGSSTDIRPSVAAQAAVVLFEAARQRRKGPGPSERGRA
jgi:TrmH family RNA methyltransferase